MKEVGLLQRVSKMMNNQNKYVLLVLLKEAETHAEVILMVDDSLTTEKVRIINIFLNYRC